MGNAPSAPSRGISAGKPRVYLALSSKIIIEPISHPAWGGIDSDTAAVGVGFFLSLLRALVPVSHL